MAKISLAGFKDPARRPRLIIWIGVAVLALAAFVVFAFSATSTYWFCAGLCHSVQDDAILTYDIGVHNTVNCLSCHEPVNADPLTFAYYKAKAGIIGAYQLYTRTNETPLNPESKLALNELHMGSAQCVQCHSENRVVTPTRGIIIDHKVHEEKEIHCTVCHNRVAHPERDYEMVNSNPRTGEISPKHADFMTMTACFRCHTLTDEAPPEGIKAPGTCVTCHTAKFELTPANHQAADFKTTGHGKLARLPVDRSTGRPAEEGAAGEEGSETAEGEAEGEAEAAPAKHIFPISKVEDIDYCSTCHVIGTFCTSCHKTGDPRSE